jgi:chromosome segregation ATPase
MKRREEEMVATARTLLVEMETHRTYEAAQALALSQSRNEASRLQDALTERQQQLAAVGSALAAAEAARDEMAVALAEAATNRFDDAGLAELNAELERLRSVVVAQAEDLEAATQSMAVLQGEIDALQARASDEREREAAERTALENQTRERENRIVALEADLAGHAESLMKATALEEALQLARDRVETLEASLEAAREIEPDSELTAALTASDALVQAQNRELEELQASRQAAEARIAELEQKLEDRGRDYEALSARLDELTVQHEANLAELESLRAREATRREAISEARAAAEAARAGAAEHEQNLAVIAAELDEKRAALQALESEKALLSQASEARQEEIRQAMVQMSQVLQERDELSEELEAEKSRRERIFAGTAGAGKSALEALESREERARQQEILLSELAQPGENRSLGDILVNAGILSREQLTEALEEQQKDPTQLLGTILIERDLTTDDAIAQAVACQLEKPVVNPMEVHIQQQAIDALHRDLCTWHVCIPLRITEDRLVVAMANPLDETAIMKLRDVSQREITPVVATPSHIMGAIDNYYGTF